jgi:hypothetical protein
MMFSDLYPDPFQSQSGMPPRWDDVVPGARYGDCLGLGLFEPSMMRFYSEGAVKMILEEHRRHLEWQRIRAERLPEMVDDVAAQWEPGRI